MIELAFPHDHLSAEMSVGVGVQDLRVDAGPYVIACLKLFRSLVHPLVMVPVPSQFLRSTQPSEIRSSRYQLTGVRESVLR